MGGEVGCMLSAIDSETRCVWVSFEEVDST